MFNQEEFSKNFKRIRKEKNVSQISISTALNISPQSVSKWERGKSLPDIQNLCELAKILGVSTDKLLGVNLDSSTFMIGVDGGGSKTEFILFNQDGLIVSKVLLGATNPNVVGLDASVETLNQGIKSLLSVQHNVSSIYIACAGFYSYGERVKKQLEVLYPDILIECKSDITGVIASATEEENCIACISGTGTVVYTKQNNDLTCYAWWGYLLNKFGSGFDMGRDAIYSALRSKEGLGEKTILEEMIEKKAEMPLEKVVEEVYKKGATYVASFVPTLIDAVNKNDKVAVSVLKDNAISLASVINDVASKTPNVDIVIASGSMFTNVNKFTDLVEENLSSSLSLIIPDTPQVLGACFLSAKLCNKLTKKLKDNLKNNYYLLRR